MANCILQSFDARRAMKFGWEPTGASRIILLVSDPLIHTEFQFSERYESISFSFTMSGGGRFKFIKYSHPERWVGLILPMTDEQEDRAWEEAKRLDGKEYDFIGLGSFSTDWIKPDSDKYWCNEACGCLIKKAYCYGDEFVPHAYHPVGTFFEMYHRITGLS